MVTVLHQQQNNACEQMFKHMNLADCPTCADILVFSGKHGLGMSTCVQHIAYVLGRKCVVLSNQAAELSFFPSQWLAEYFGLFTIKCSSTQLPRSLVAIAKLVELKVIVIEDFQDFKSIPPRHISTIIDDLTALRRAVPGLCIILTVADNSLSWLKYAISELSLVSAIVTMRPLLRGTDFSSFINGYVYAKRRGYLDVLSVPKVLELLYQLFELSIGRLVLAIDMVVRAAVELPYESLLIRVEVIVIALRGQR
ncbi:hypothetical protein IFT37_20540 [Pseudomonas fluorescens]|uniref:hypothetical protein n=1 Tax=Pseudomonas fluorescens TaxID=294 RepID=UPI0017828B57|nr:hypothetical protein [Pseudomonas fluorescens]MBD8148177.1 hypothetical protein [Pseudomonas fluorescens]MBD8178216.1 hypothetical protein [Pseudomonas fluorescens]MBD8557810.1 hypothetical protein [Pseudomonas fluorescens]MBD8747491.1 hypothetical protein [Pseudomonas fluorescens]MBD8753238.1 hypothetical protein [Pseudomonas fluorescens]